MDVSHQRMIKTISSLLSQILSHTSCAFPIVILHHDLAVVVKSLSACLAVWGVAHAVMRKVRFGKGIQSDAIDSMYIESKRAKKRKAEQALENDGRLLPRLQAREERLRVAMASFDTVTRQEAVVAAKATLRALDGQIDKHYTIRQGYQDISARIDDPPAYYLEAVAANEAAIVTFKQSLTRATEAVASAVEKPKENWMGYHAVADELVGAESELAGLKKAIERGPLAIKVLEAQLAVAESGEQAFFELGEEEVDAIINTVKN